MILLYITICLLVIYSLLILNYHAAWQELIPFSSTDDEPSIRISIIIPARNEEENIGKLLASIEKQAYPNQRFEVIVVDDHSTDNTAVIVNSFSFAKLIKLEPDNINSYKKKAIETGINEAKGDLIVTTDADCVVKENWLKTIAAFKEKTRAVFIASPVMMEYNSGVLQTFGALDFLVLQGITAASVHKRIHNMCNGANLAYEKKAFLDVNGFTGIDHIASGDDMLLMQKMAQQFPGKISYLLSKDAIVTTQATKSWKEFFSQRIRWASKATNYTDLKIFSALFLVYFFNCCLLALFITGFWIRYIWWGLVSILVVKTIVELIFLYPVAKFYNEQKLLTRFPFFQPLHIVYTIIAGWLGVFGSFEWKGRRVK